MIALETAYRTMNDAHHHALELYEEAKRACGIHFHSKCKIGMVAGQSHRFSDLDYESKRNEKKKNFSLTVT